MRPAPSVSTPHALPGLLAVTAPAATLAERRAVAARRRALAEATPRPLAGVRRGAAALLRGLASRLEHGTGAGPALSPEHSA